MAYTQTVLKEERVGTLHVEITVDSDGKFGARDAVSKESLPGLGMCKSMADLKKRLREFSGHVGKAVRAVKFDPEYYQKDWRTDSDSHYELGDVEEITITGIHGGNGNVLIRRGGGTEQLRAYGTTDVFHPHLVGEKDLAELRELHEMKVQVEEAIKAWADARRMDIKAELAKAPAADCPGGVKD